MKYFTLTAVIIGLILTGCDSNVKSESINSIEFFPVIEHLSPLDGSGFIAGSEVSFSCRVYSMYENLTSLNLEWRSNLDGELYSHILSEEGLSSFMTDSLSEAYHEISIIVTHLETGDTITKSFHIFNELPDFIDYDDYIFLGKLENSLYFESQITTSWSIADSICSAWGHLVTITSRAENDFLEAKVTVDYREFWIGLYYNSVLDSFKWVTNEEYLFDNFQYEIEPDAEIPFIYFDSSNGVWGAAGYYAKPYILEIEL